MCDFKPGDEVVCVNDSDWSPQTFQPRRGQIYTISEVVEDRGRVGIGLCEARDTDDLFAPRNFRKVQRRDLSAWLETAATDTNHLDKPIKTPARPKVDALLKRVRSGAFG